MSALAGLLLKLNTLHKEPLHWNLYIWDSQSQGVMTVVCWINIMAITPNNDVKVVDSSQPSITQCKSANQKIGIHTVYESWIIITNYAQ